MELKKKKETLWTIDKKDQDGCFKLRSTEVGGKIDLIGIGLSKSNIEVFFDMTPSEFKSFFTILKAFKDLVNSEDVEFSDNKMDELHNSQISIHDNTIENRVEKNTIKPEDPIKTESIENENITYTDVLDSNIIDQNEMAASENKMGDQNENDQKIDQNDYLKHDQESIANNSSGDEVDSPFNEESINIEEIFKDIDSVTPQDIKEQSQEFENEDPSNDDLSEENEIKSPIDSNIEKDDDKESENKEKEEKGDEDEDLNPLDWDPW